MDGITSGLLIGLYYIIGINIGGIFMGLVRRKKLMSDLTIWMFTFTIVAIWPLAIVLTAISALIVYVINEVARLTELVIDWRNEKGKTR